MVKTTVRATVKSSLNSDGLWYPSVSIYFSGCDKPVKCKNCHNKEIQNKDVGFLTNEIEIINSVESVLDFWLNSYETISLCFLGGEPLAEYNKNMTRDISKYFKNKYNERIKTIIYSWRYLEQLDLEYAEYMDFGVLGEFDETKKDLNLIPASTNQYIYDFGKNKKIEPIKGRINI